MNAKTTKYLAVLAVLAVAFAGCVVLFQEQGSDAAAGEAVTKETYATAHGTDEIFKSIKLETTADPKSVVLYTSGMEIVPGAAYFFDKDATVSIPESVTLATPVVFFVLDGVSLNVVGPTKDITDKYGMIEFVNVKSYDAGIITLDAPKADATLFSNTGYAKGLATVTAEYAAADLKVSYEKGENFGIKADKDASPVKKFVLSAIKMLDVYDSMTLTGAIEEVKICTAGIALTLNEFTGTIKNNNATLVVKGFTGTINDATLTNVTIAAWTAGEIESANDNVAIGAITLKQGQSIKAAMGVKIPMMTVSFTRYVTDIYMFTNHGLMTAGTGGFTITAGYNGLELAGTVKATAEVYWEFDGAAYITGTIDAADVGVTIEGDGTYDVTLGSLTVFTNGMELTQGAAIADKAVINVRETLTIPAGETLKVGEGAYLRVYGAEGLVIEEENEVTAKIFTAGNVVADVVKLGEDIIDDTEAKNLLGVAFVYGDGAITGSNIKFTKVDEARMAHIDLSGRGDLGINGTTVVENDYYFYSFIAFYPVAAQDVFNLAADSRIVAGIIPFADVLDQDVNLPLLYAKYKINYNQMTPTFVIVYKETYEVTLTGVTTDYTVKDSEGNVVFVEDGKATLIYGETYTLNGKVSTSKYTYTSDLNVGLPEGADPVQPIDFIGNTLSKFTQVRQIQTISVEVGKEQTITVTLVQTDTPFAAGDVFMEYSIDGGVTSKTVKLVEKDDKLIGTFKVFNTDNVITKFVDKKYFAFVAGTATENITAQNLTPAQIEAGWDYAFKGENNTKTTGKFTVTYSLDKVKDAYYLIDNDNLLSNLRITITFQDYYLGDKGHKQSYTVVPAKAAATPEGAKLEVDTYVGETYTMTWTDLSDVKEKMTYGADNTAYAQGTLVTIGAQATNYTLTLTPIKYADLKNETSLPLTVVFGDDEVEIAAGQTLVKGITIGEDYITLASKGKEVMSWYGTFMPLNGTEADLVPINGAGATSIAKVNVTEGGLVTIKTAKVYNIIYLVTVEPTDHSAITYYDQAGYYGRDMVVYVQPDSGYNVTGVQYTYQEEDMDAPVTKEATRQVTEGQVYWGYSMPASDVLLKPIIEKNEYEVKFVDQNERELETFNQAPHTAFLKDVTEIPGAKAVAAVSTPQIGDFKFIEKDQTVSFTMPAANVVVKITYETKEYSEDVAVAITEKADGLWITVVALDGKNVMPGTITLTCTVWEYDKDLDFWYPEEYDVPAEVEGDSIVTGCTISLDKVPMGTAYVQAVYESLVADGDSGMIVYN